MKDWMAIEQARRSQRLYDSLEGQVLMREGAKRRSPDAGHHVAEAGRAVHLEAQDERVDEEPDQIFRAGVPAPRGRRSNEDVLLAAPAMEQGAEDAEQEHVRRRLEIGAPFPVSYTHLTLPTIYAV